MRYVSLDRCKRGSLFAAPGGAAATLQAAAAKLDDSTHAITAGSQSLFRSLVNINTAAAYIFGRPPPNFKEHACEASRQRRTFRYLTILRLCPSLEVEVCPSR